MRSTFLLLCALAPALHAQPIIEPKDGKVVVPMTLSPAGVKKPLSRLYLTPQYTDMQPGNKIPTFMKAFMEMNSFFSKEMVDQRTKWGDMKLADLPLDEMKKHGGLGGLAYRDPKAGFNNLGGNRPLIDVDEGARQLNTDWQIWFNLRRDHIGTLLPEVQKFRELAQVLKYRMRYEIRTGDFEKAAYTARSFYGLAKAFEEHPTLIGLLVGISVEAICLNIMEEMIQQPDCPNLYWSLMEMPDVVLNPRMALQGERVFSQSMFGNFLKDQGGMSAEEFGKELKNFESMVGLMAGDGGIKMPMHLGYALWASDAKTLESARQYLIDTGMKADAVKKFNPVQVMFAFDIRKYEVMFDDAVVPMLMPFPEAKPLAEKWEAALKQDKQSIVARQMLPAMWKVREALARIQQRLAYLRVIEAIRLHAHENKGALPEKLSDTKLPLPNDPVTGKPFEYTVKASIATLHGANSSEKRPDSNRYYELQIKK